MRTAVLEKALSERFSVVSGYNNNRIVETSHCPKFVEKIPDPRIRIQDEFIVAHPYLIDGTLGIG